ncbi:hypothetical protein [Nocardia seriolae]|uniref:DUF2306 domain-containing protein n=1 Tax=Nocardia seriolae TaxID=37332 RepID=A0ABC9YPT1_9NOCA|nr:hypothetical protein [Nocardia seriolae]BEK94164.1 hypothetical protein NSER024013_20700 [Nocardia seriolae]GAM45036.1 hypothetical protein NS07_v2contig00010-0091 [Nocardia seriolae]GAP27056.1 hypothetical protein NSK11_contig00012-0091 [Nocardia seriolae]
MPAYPALVTLHVTAGALGRLLGPMVAWTDSRTHSGATDLAASSPPPTQPPPHRAPLRSRHSTLWPWYLTTVAAICATATLMVLWHRPDLWWLIPVSALTFALALLGRHATARPGPWTHAYVHGLGGSYIALWTAPLVVSFALHGPLYGLSELIAWLGPTLLVLPLLEFWRRRLPIPIGV